MKYLIDLPKPVKLISFDIVGSTNDKAKELAEQNAEAWTVIWSKAQNHGRGRQNKTWISPVGNLYLSLILRPDCEPEKLGQFSFLIPLAIADALKKYLSNAEIKYKWPNDIIINNKKIAGILLESSLSGSKVGWLVVGIGINIKSFPSTVDFPATSLAAENGDTVLEQLLEKLIISLKQRVKDYTEKGFSEIRTEWLKNAYGLGKKTVVKLSQEIITGTFSNIDENGLLEVKQENGTIRKISAGEVFFENFGELGNVTGN